MASQPTPQKKTYSPLVSLNKARCSTPHFLARGAVEKRLTTGHPSVHRQAGSDGRLAGHFTKLAELQRPARTWEDGQTPVENGGGDWGGPFFGGFLKKGGWKWYMFKVGCGWDFLIPSSHLGSWLNVSKTWGLVLLFWSKMLGFVWWKMIALVRRSDKICSLTWWKKCWFMKPASGQWSDLGESVFFRMNFPVGWFG